MATREFDDEVLITGYAPAAQFLTEHGFPTSKSLLSKVGSPAIGEGPQVAGYWLGRPAFRPSALLAWARGRLKPASEARAPKSIPIDATASTAPATRGPGRPRKQSALPAIDAPPVQPAEALPSSGLHE